MLFARDGDIPYLSQADWNVHRQSRGKYSRSSRSLCRVFGKKLTLIPSVPAFYTDVSFELLRGRQPIKINSPLVLHDFST